MQLAEVLAAVQGLSPESRAQLQEKVLAAKEKAGRKWTPNPGPQTEAYFSLADCILYGGEPGGGKALAIGTPIPTPFGWSTMAELRVGDAVFDENGVQCSVVCKSDVFTEDTYRLTFSDGSQIVAGARHEWITGTRAERMRELKCNDEWRARRRSTRTWIGKGKRPDLSARNRKLRETVNLPREGRRTTEEIASSLKVEGGRNNHSIRVSRPLQLPEADLPVDPYLLGAWLGDGGTTTGRMTIAEPEMVRAVNDTLCVRWEMRKGSNKYDYGIRGGFTATLRTIGVLGNKHIPVVYLRASAGQRLSLLQGLMDTDGYCDKRGQCEISLTRKELIESTHELLSSLGIKAQLREGVASLNGRVIGPKWRLKFLTDLPAFRLARKLIRQKRGGFRGVHDGRRVVSAELIEPVPLQCIQVDSPSHMYLCGWAMIPTHNSQLGLGLAFNCHERSLVMRRQYGDLDRLVEDALKIHGSRNGFNGSPPPKLRVSDKQIIDFAAANRVGDEQGQMGKGRDLLFIDEATHFAEQQIRFLMGWNRTDTPGQRVRTVLATNPPLTAEGLWVNTMFAPWLDPTYHNPAQPGELRWVVSDDDGKDEWVSGPDDVRVNAKGKTIRPTSRTYIPAKVSDNPYYAATDYERQLDAMPEPYRSLLMGGFQTTFRDADNQVIPTAWIKLAQERWTPKRPEGVPMCAMGVDASGGGEDPMVIAPRYDGWYPKLIIVPGKDIPVDRIGPHCAGVVVSHRRDNALVVIDMGGGYGGSMHDHLKGNEVDVYRYLGAESTTKRSRDGKLKFTNTRSAAYWLFREALDPAQLEGSPIMLPDDPTLVADLAAPTFEMTPNGIKIESKEKVCERLGRSTDNGDAVVMAWWSGAKLPTHFGVWQADQQVNRRAVPVVNMGPRRRKRG